MNVEQILAVLAVCVPVFAVLAVGKVLEVKGKLDESHRGFISWLVYAFALPALIFVEVAGQRITDLWQPAMVIPGFIAIFVCIAIYMLLVKLIGLKGGTAAAFVFGTFWANVSYMGFPLSGNAFPETGMALASVYNAFVMPLFIIGGFLVIGFYGVGDGHALGWKKIKQIITNPVLLAAVIGIVVSLLSELVRNEEGVLQLPTAVMGLFLVIGKFLRLIGGMGLPLALLVVGASLQWSSLKGRFGLLAVVVFGKLVLTPLIILLSARWLFPEVVVSDPAVLGVAVLLGGTPNAVASYVIAREVGADEHFVASMLVASTGLSAITIPLWLYFVM